MENLIKKVKKEHLLNKEELVGLLSDNSINEKLFSAADEIRHECVGDEVHLRALIEFSNICKRNCFYCGLRAENKNAQRYRLTAEQIVKTAKIAINKGYKTIVLQSGEDSFFSAERLADIIKKIKQCDVAVTLGVGELSFDDYKILKNAGTDRFLLRIETTDENLYKKLHPNMSLNNRKQCLYNLKELGYETGTGCLVGLPEQTIDSLAEDILFFKELNADMIGIGPFIPHKDTPLGNAQSGDFTLALKVMALTRLMLPYINIPATTAMETLVPNGRNIALQSGANVVMPNMTAMDYRKKYEIYPDKVSVDYSTLKENLSKIGRIISKDKGNSKNRRDI